MVYQGSGYHRQIGILRGITQNWQPSLGGKYFSSSEPSIKNISYQIQVIRFAVCELRNKNFELLWWAY